MVGDFGVIGGSVGAEVAVVGALGAGGCACDFCEGLAGDGVGVFGSGCMKGCVEVGAVGLEVCGEGGERDEDGATY